MPRKLKNAHARKLTGRRVPNAVARRPPKPVESTRERILTSAARLFAERGFEGASMPAIAKASGITAGAIYKHFKGKGELLLEVVKRSFESSPLFMQSSTAGIDASALPRLAALYAEPELKLVRQLSIEIHSAARTDSKVRQVLALTNELAIRHVRDTIVRAQDAGKLDSKLNPELAARLFGVLVMGLVHMDTLLPDLVGDRAWSKYLRECIATLIGAN